MTGVQMVRAEDRGWVEFQIPESTPPVHVLRFRDDPQTRAMTLLVRFPAGWSRPIAGYYEASEEFLLIEGDLRIGEVEYGPGDFGLWKAGLNRGPSSSQKGALTLAHFEGPARWRSQPPASPVDAGDVRFRYEAAAEPSPLGVAGHRLGSAWMLEEPATAAPPDVDLELFSVPERCWAWVPAGESVPTLSVPCLCWLHQPRYHAKQES